VAVPAPAPLVTVIVITKDDPAGLRATLQSIAQQSAADAEVVIVAKGSSLPVAPSGFGLPAEPVLIEQSSAGISAAFNEGIARARGRWLNFLNGGDSYRDAGVLQRMRPHLELPEPRIVAARARDRLSGIHIPRDHTFAARNVELVSHQASFFRRELFERLGGYSPDFRIRMDFEWMLRVPADTEVAWVDDTIVEFEGGGISSTQPLRSCLEEYSALQRHPRGPLRVAALFGLYLPLRIGRHALRRLGLFGPGPGARADHAG
jgi:glycosyltransferase involved in cell wall biosynthesis